jgi:ribosomal protein S18 acetylase RimI-like enzyme
MHPSKPANIRSATRPEEEGVLATLTLAFSADPAVRWLYPDPGQYLRSFPRFALCFGGEAFKAGTALRTEGFSAAALWMPPHAHLDEEELTAHLRSSISEERQAEVFAVFDEMGRYHPREPHWYLPLIGVEPYRQGQGLGGALMQHVLSVCDREALPAYLESTNPENARLYERLGFETLGEIAVNGAQLLRPMWREPRTGSSAI